MFNVDPVAVAIMAVVGSGGVGWLVGPFWGNEVFRIVHRRVGGQIAEVRGFLISFYFVCFIWFWFWFDST